MRPNPKQQTIDNPVRDLLLDVGFGHRPIPSPNFAPVVGGTWDHFPLQGYTPTISIGRDRLHMCMEATPENYETLDEMMALLNRPIRLELDDGSEIQAEFANLKAFTLGERARVDLFNWQWHSESAPVLWAGSLSGRVPTIGNVLLCESVGNQRQLSQKTMRFAGKYVWYLVPIPNSDDRAVIVDTGEFPMDITLLRKDFHALRLTLGGRLAVEYLSGLDQNYNPVAAISLASYSTSFGNFRPPVADVRMSGHVWLPAFFQLLSAKIHAEGVEPCLTGITAYLDSEAEHLDGAYMKAQLGLEAFSNKIVKSGSPDLLVSDPKEWKRWVESLKVEIESRLIDPKYFTEVRNKMLAAARASSGDVVRKAFANYTIALPKECLDEIRNRNLSAHGFWMNSELEHNIAVDPVRLEHIQTLLAALISLYIGYKGPLEGYEVADDGGRKPPAWWPVNLKIEDVQAQFIAERIVNPVAPNPSPSLGNLKESPGDPMDRAIQDRAYYLWQNKTGSAWWDLVANWLEAETQIKNERLEAAEHASCQIDLEELFLDHAFSSSSRRVFTKSLSSKLQPPPLRAHRLLLSSYSK